MKTRAFLNLEHRSHDADAKPLDDYKHEIGCEMIVELDDETQEATSTQDFGKGEVSFRFTDLRPGELSPYASLEELTALRVTNGHFGVGSH